MKATSSSQGICFVVPGQGTAFPGMFHDFVSHAAVAQKWVRKADLLSKRFGVAEISIYFEEPYALFPYTKTKEFYTRQNLSLLTLQVALADALIEQGIAPSFVAGHSFGEFAALVISGALPFDVVFECVCKRELACPRINEAAYLLAVHSNVEKIKNTLSKEWYEIANVNSPRQTVLAVPWDRMILVESALIKAKVVSARLDAPQPYHSSHMDGAHQNLKRSVAELRLRARAPHRAIYSSVFGEWLENEKAEEPALRQLLGEQLRKPVDFISEVEGLHRGGATFYVELGAKALLTPLVRSILGKGIQVVTAAKLLQPPKPKKRTQKGAINTDKKLLSVLNQALVKVTGYRIEDISLEDSFQEDLGMDSMQVTQLFFEILQKTGTEAKLEVGFRPPKTVKDLLENMERALKGHNLRGGAKAHFDYYMRTFSAAPDSVPCLFRQGPMPFLVLDISDAHACQTLQDPNRLKQLVEQEGAKGLVLLLPEIDRLELGEATHSQMVQWLTMWQQSLKKSAWIRELSMALVSSGGSRSLALPFQAFARSLIKEEVLGEIRYFHFDAPMDRSGMLSLIGKEFTYYQDLEVQFSEGTRRVVSWLPIESTAMPLAEEAVILAIGGAKGISFQLVREAVTRYHCHAYLMGRSSPEAPQVQQALQQIEQESDRVRYLQGDARVPQELNGVIEKILSEHSKIDLILNGSGSEQSELFLNKTQAQLSLELGNKIESTQNILGLLDRYPIDKMIHHTSVVGRVGNRGQSIYALTNGIVEWLVEQSNEKAHRNASVAIQWPPWKSVGMTAIPEAASLLEHFGVSLLGVDRARALFNQVPFSLGHSVVAVRDPNDDLLYEIPLKPAAKCSQGIDSAAAKGGEIVFRKHFSVEKEEYLNDHQIAQKPCVPGAVIAGMLMEAGAIVSSQVTHLKDFSLIRPLLVTEKGAELGLCFTCSSDGWEVALSSAMALGQAKLAYGTEEESLSPLSARPEMDEIIFRAQRESLYQESRLFHGPSFQSLLSVEVNSKSELRAELAYTVESMRYICAYSPQSRFIQWVDAAFQAIGVLGWLKEKRLYLPVGVKSLCQKHSIVTEKESPHFLHVTNSSKHGDELTADAVICDDQDRSIIEMRAVQLKVVNLSEPKSD